MKRGELTKDTFNRLASVTKFHQINIIKNTHHWEDLEKQIKDYEYLRETTEYLLEIISENLSKIHHVNENKEYWRVVIFIWLNL